MKKTQGKAKLMCVLMAELPNWYVNGRNKKDGQIMSNCDVCPRDSRQDSSFDEKCERLALQTMPKLKSS